MLSVISRLSETPGSIHHADRRHGEDSEAVLAELGFGPDEVARLRGQGVA